MKRIQNMIPDAIQACHEILLDNGRKTAIDREFNGYISSFGASVISAGLLPSIIFYSQKGDSATDRPKIILCIQNILRKHGYSNLNLLDKVRTLFTGNTNQAEISLLTDKIFDAAIALKLAIRTFPKSKKEQL
ncbi:MAG: hypothetical protein M0R21_13020 [Lentimicrobiaceae bacterium]|nr:hypothetical protein [Lentimicrobiaceae bacterium]